MDFNEYMNSILDDNYKPFVSVGIWSEEKTNEEKLNYKEQLTIKDEHEFMNNAFEKFELIRREEGAIIAALFLHEKYKELYAIRAKQFLLGEST